jgi:hypothetical protein
VPRYLVIDIRQIDAMNNIDSDRVETIAARIIKDNLPAFRALAK